MEQRVKGFQEILKGKSGKYYSAMDQIPETEEVSKTDLVFDSQSRTMYYQVHMGRAMPFRTPYVNKNGKYCSFMNGEFIEVSRRKAV